MRSTLASPGSINNYEAISKILYMQGNTCSHKVYKAKTNKRQAFNATQYEYVYLLYKYNIITAHAIALNCKLLNSKQHRQVYLQKKKKNILYIALKYITYFVHMHYAEQVAIYNLQSKF